MNHFPRCKISRERGLGTNLTLCPIYPFRPFPFSFPPSFFFYAFSLPFLRSFPTHFTTPLYLLPSLSLLLPFLPSHLKFPFFTYTLPLPSLLPFPLFKGLCHAIFSNLLCDNLVLNVQKSSIVVTVADI